MPIRILVVLTIFIALLSGCSAGVNFTKPEPNELVLGKTTKPQIITLLGQPNGKGKKVANGEELDIISYAYASLSDDPIFPGITPARAYGFYFSNDILVGKEYTSSFKVDNTYYDVEKVKSVKRGMSKADVIALLGQPGGAYLYPVIAEKKGYALVYIFAQTKGFKSQRSTLVVELNQNGKVEKTEFNQIGQL